MITSFAEIFIPSEIFYFHFYIYNFLNFSLYLKMYCLKCRRVTETQNITTATSKNSRLMRRGQCVTCGKTKSQFVKKEVVGEAF